MDNMLEELKHRRAFVSNMNYEEANSRLTGFLNWLDSNETTAAIISEMKDDIKVAKMLEHSDFHTPPSVDVTQFFDNYNAIK